MKSQTVNNQTFNLNLNKSKEILLELLQNQINDCKLQSLTEFVQDNTTSNEDTNKKIHELQAKRNELNALFEDKNSKEYTVELNFSINNKS